MNSQLKDIVNLKDGWKDGEGKAYKESDIKWLSNCFEINYPHKELPIPYFYPSLENNVVSVEWTMGVNEITLDVNLKDHIGNWECLNNKTEKNHIRAFNLDKDFEGIVKIMRRLYENS